jgi:hypothetical protein
MTLHIRHLKIQISTPAGRFGVDIPFELGLFVLHADNTSGKSTCLNSILYALGLEGMLSPSYAVPLSHAVTDGLDFNGERHEVLESEVLLEISNGMDIMTVRRQIKGSQNQSLINVWRGAMLSQTETSYVSSDYFVRVPGGASRELGFHRLLAEFVGWQLPTVPTYNENNVPLYIETLFPLMFVEQKHGWSSLRNRFPTYLKIKDVARRAFEFIFALDAEEIATQKTNLHQQEKELRARWSEKLDECNRLSSSIDAIVNNLPIQPLSSWPPSTQPRILISQTDEWIDINQVIIVLEEHLHSLLSQEIPRTDQVAEASRIQLEEKQEQLLNIEIEIKLKFEKIEYQTTHIEEIMSRISSLNEELLKNKDLKKLSSLGSMQNLQTHSGECPTCHQSINESLISAQELSKPVIMSIDQNVEFIREQLKIFQAMHRSEISTLDLKKMQVNALKSRAADVMENIRALRTTLTSQNNAPSYAAIEERIRLAERIKYIKSVQAQVDGIIGDFSYLSGQWHEIQSSLKNLPKEMLSNEDISKIHDLEISFQGQLQEYGFDSLSHMEVNVSRDTYFPEHEGFDLRFDLSASDYIRVVWAYLLGLLEVARDHQTNHLGLLILDEPRQQSALEASIEAFLNRVSHCQRYNQQVIIATSESEEVLNKYLGNIPHSRKSFDHKVIAPL